MEFRRIMAAGFDSFSGVKFNVDASRGLDGYCIFLLTRSRLQSVLTTPVVTIVEAKNDNVRCELGQCIASIVAAREFNSRFVPPAAAVQDVVTAGSAWKFLRLGSAEWKLDIEEYCVSQLGRIIGIPAHILKAACC